MTGHSKDLIASRTAQNQTMLAQLLKEKSNPIVGKNTTKMSTFRSSNMESINGSLAKFNRIGRTRKNWTHNDKAKMLPLFFKRIMQKFGVIARQNYAQNLGQPYLTHLNNNSIQSQQHFFWDRN